MSQRPTPTTCNNCGAPERRKGRSVCAECDGAAQRARHANKGKVPCTKCGIRDQPPRSNWCSPCDRAHRAKRHSKGKPRPPRTPKLAKVVGPNTPGMPASQRPCSLCRLQKRVNGQSWCSVCLQEKAKAYNSGKSIGVYTFGTMTFDWSGFSGVVQCAQCPTFGDFYFGYIETKRAAEAHWRDEHGSTRYKWEKA